MQRLAEKLFHLDMNEILVIFTCENIESHFNIFNIGTKCCSFTASMQKNVITTVGLEEQVTLRAVFCRLCQIIAQNLIQNISGLVYTHEENCLLSSKLEDEGVNVRFSPLS